MFLVDFLALLLHFLLLRCFLAPIHYELHHLRAVALAFIQVQLCDVQITTA